MKILHLIPSLSKGGAERLALDICNELRVKKGIQVKLITFRKENDYTFLTKEIEWQVIPSKVTPSLKGKGVVNIDALQTAIDSYQPDIIHSHLFETEIILSEINYPKAKYIVHFHDNMVQFENWSIRTLFNKRKLTNFYEKTLILKRYSEREMRFIAISKDTLSYMESVLPNPFKKTLLPNAIDTKRFKPGEEKHKTPHLVMIGSLVDKKGQELAIQTMVVLVKRGLSIRLDLLGDGPVRKKLEELIIKEDLSDAVTLHGNVNHPEHYLQQAVLYLHTAKYEPFGLVLLEAMACGLPVVCTDGGGNGDLIEEGVNGYLVQHRDPDLLADKIETLLKDGKKRESMSAEAVNFASEYDISSYSEKLLAIYRS